MAVELEQFLTEQLARLPEDHPDHRFVAGLAHAVTAYVARPLADFPAVSEQRATAADVIPQAQTADASPELGRTPEQARVHLHGRLGYPPTFRTSPKGVLVGTFPLAVRDAAGVDQPTWYKAFVFRQRAERLRELQLTKGQAVEVVGYGYTHTLTRRDGTTSVEHRVNAVAVKVR